MLRPTRIVVVLAVLAVISCVTINIYFPAEEVKSAADKIVHEVWGTRAETPSEPGKPAPPPAEKGSPGSLLRLPFGAKTVFAAQNIDVSTPEIRAIKQAMKQRSRQLFPYLDEGVVGIGRNGLLKVRTTEGLNLRSRAEVNRLVSAENADRLRLYKEIARANGFPEKAGEVQAIFADSWRNQAARGWYLEGKDGSWKKKS
jgi:uncharacterized protein YdbL (DUF1318 family)